jgi:hypothetical protein
MRRGRAAAEGAPGRTHGGLRGTVGTLLLGLLLAACSSTASGSRPTTTVSVPPPTTAPTTTSTTVPATTQPTSSTTTSASGPPPCSAGQLAVTEVGVSGAAGTIGVAYRLTGTGAACTLDGYPVVSFFVESSGGATAPASASVVDGGLGGVFASSPTAIVVSAGQSAGFLLAYSDVPSGGSSTCPDAAGFRLTPPGGTGVAVVATTMPLCGEPVHVSPVVPASELTTF